jgi:hypothetical protein
MTIHTQIESSFRVQCQTKLGPKNFFFYFRYLIHLEHKKIQIMLVRMVEN